MNHNLPNDVGAGHEDEWQKNLLANYDTWRTEHPDEYEQLLAEPPGKVMSYTDEWTPEHWGGRARMAAARRHCSGGEAGPGRPASSRPVSRPADVVYAAEAVGESTMSPTPRLDAVVSWLASDRTAPLPSLNLPDWPTMTRAERIAAGIRSCSAGAPLFTDVEQVIEVHPDGRRIPPPPTRTTIRRKHP